MRTAATMLALALAASACGGQKQEQEFTRADVDVIKKTAADLSAAFGSKNVDAAVELFSPDAVFKPLNAPALRGKDAIRLYFTKRFSEGVSLRLEPEDVGGHGPIAYQTGSYSLSIERAGEAPVRDRGKYVFISRMLNNKWLFERAIWSSDLPPPTAAPVAK